MFGELISRCLLMLFGYAYPAFECYKTVMKKSVQIEELRFWCQYWIIVALITMLERIGDIFISWLPMYGEMKLAIFIYLWYPKTKGTGYVFDMLLRPYIIEHETDIEEKLQQWRTKAWDLAIFYWNNCSELSQSAFFQFFQYLASSSSSSSTSNPKHPVPQILKEREMQREKVEPRPNGWFPFFRKFSNETKPARKNNCSPSAPLMAGARANRPVSDNRRADVVEAWNGHNETDYVFSDDDDDTDRRSFYDGLKTDRQYDTKFVRR